jgi:hypothetical protein
MSQVSPPSASAKSYAEIILGKYGRMGGQQRHAHQQHPHSSSSGPDDKGLSYGVPKTQVIEHITKLITINEAVVDTSEIDSVKPRRSSLSSGPWAAPPAEPSASWGTHRHLGYRYRRYIYPLVLVRTYVSLVSSGGYRGEIV